MDNFDSSIWLEKVKRWVRVMLVTDAISVLTFLAIGGGVAATLVATKMNASLLVIAWIVAVSSFIIAIILIGLLLFKTTLEYRFRTYDPATVLPLDRQFFNDMKEKQSKAAAICLQRLNNTQWKDIKSVDDVDEVLDFLTDVGFYLRGGQISDEVAHHHFFHWIRGWYCALESYIKYFAEKNNEDAPYRDVEALFQRTARVEMRYEKHKTMLTNDDLIEFLETELAEVKPPSSTRKKSASQH